MSDTEPIAVNTTQNLQSGRGREQGQQTSGSGMTSATKLQVHNLSKSFGSAQIMKNINFDFADNAITTVLGPSGTGKSVLIKHLVGLLEPDTGEVLVDGDDIWAMTEDERYSMRTRFGVCWQDGALFGSMNLYDNTAFPLRTHTKMSEKEIEEKVMRLLEEVGLGHSAHKAPNEISGGMKKRAGFARAMVMDPEFVIFDEPDSGLDPVRTALLCELIREIHAENGGCYLVISHDLTTARRIADFIAVLWSGKIVESGPKEEVFDSSNPFVNQFLHADVSGPLSMD